MAPSAYNYELFEVSFPAEYVAHVEINRPSKLNAFGQPMWDNIRDIFLRLSSDENVRCVVLSGKGEKAFTAGLDVTSAAKDGVTSDVMKKSDPARTAFNIREHILAYQRAITPIEKCSKPVICVLHGYAFGAGIDISSACDIRFCAEGTKFCVKETDIGLAADVGTLSRLPKCGVSLSWVKDICYTSRVFDPAEALRMGYVSLVAPTKADAIKAALQHATLISSKSPIAVQGTKNVIDYSRDHSIADGLEYVAVWNGAMLQTDDVKNAMTSGLKRTKPVFSKL